MGVKNLLKFIKTEFLKNIHDFILKYNISSFFIDSSCFMHKAKLKGGLNLVLYNNSDYSVEYFRNCFKMLENFKNLKCVFVFDGMTPDIKKKEYERRRVDNKKNLIVLYAKLKNTWGSKRCVIAKEILKITETSVIKQDIINYITSVDNFQVYQADYEADDDLARLSLNTENSCIITEDSDLIVYGCEKIIFKFYSYEDYTCFEYYDKNNQNWEKLMNFKGEILKKEYWERFIYFCIFSGCDYFKKEGLGMRGALKICRDDKKFNNFIKYELSEEEKLLVRDAFEKFKKYINL